ncbi:cyclic AMP-responsive element-binding protein 3-like protein 2 isoform X3 [Desmodus rotundus]|nr:cyclic AMP-responsive element-binding protein 3-like protein 2 isoform X3 [Desmodus rotundus]XP_045047046.2 cyclic AMP-responsive element-binding protein 3-like protein 2 isoform X3 [Desmodus rotundus]XP_045047047.2 cyclic AMP-responsive element-binding protein 3-like protein 2 isoform X3 [Desmodus rotundus]
MEVEPSPTSPAPLIQAEHSYSLSEEPRAQSPFTHVTSSDSFNDGSRGKETGSQVSFFDGSWRSFFRRTYTQADANDTESEKWYLSADFPSATIKTEPITEESPPGLVPSGTLTITAISTPFEKEEPPLEMNTGVDSSCQTVIPKIKLEPHEVDQFLNFSSKEASVDHLHLPPTPPSSHSSDSEGSLSPSPRLHPFGLPQTHGPARAVPRAPSTLSSSPLLTAPHKLQGSGPLVLTEEEKRTLIAEGYPIPTKLPLTKSEEKALKKIRRKIKNKISAQESRRKKKEYMDSLEKKVESCSTENLELRKKVEVLENTNRTLLQQLQKLQTLVMGKVSRTCKLAGTQTGTCLMVVVLCFAVAFGSFFQGYGPYPSASKMALPSQQSVPEPYTASVVKSRNLLIYEEHSPLEEPSSPASAGELGRWDRSPSLLRASALESRPDVDLPHFIISNETSLEKSVLLELQQHLVSANLEGNETLKVVELDRRVNATF